MTSQQQQQLQQPQQFQQQLQQEQQQQFAAATKTILSNTAVSAIEKFHAVELLLSSVISSMTSVEVLKVKPSLAINTVVVELCLVVVSLRYLFDGVSLIRLVSRSILQTAFAQETGIVDKISPVVLNGVVCVAAMLAAGVICVLAYAGFLAKSKNTKAQSILEHSTTAIISLIAGVGVGRVSH